MKKKAKLFTTIASLCMAVALMAFGVYAATNQNLDVESTVSFKTTSVYVDIAAKAYEGDVVKATYAGFTHDSGDKDKVPTKWVIDTDAATEGNQGLNFTEEAPKIKYEFEIKNYTDTAITVSTKSLTEVYDYGGQATVSVTANDGTDLVYATDGFSFEIGAAENYTTPTTKTLTITLTLGSFNASFENQPVNYSLEILRKNG